MKRLETEWESYRARVIPAGASAIQLAETRNGFYAGAWCLFTHIMGHLTPGEDPTAEDIAMLDEIHSELMAFARSKAG